MNSNKYQVVQVSWTNENNQMPIVLLDARIRQKLAKEIRECVYVKFHNVKRTAMIAAQFREHIGIGDVCTLNSKLAKELKVKAGQKVTIETDVVESDVQAIKQAMPQSMPDFIQMIGALRPVGMAEVHIQRGGQDENDS